MIQKLHLFLLTTHLDGPTYMDRSTQNNTKGYNMKRIQLTENIAWGTLENMLCICILENMR